MKADIEEQLREAKRLFEEARGSRGSGKMRRLTLKEMGRDMSLRPASEVVRAESGPFNWYALRPDANGGSEVANAGTGSLDELTKWLPTDEVMFALTRIGFGKGACCDRSEIHLRALVSGECESAQARTIQRARGRDSKTRRER